MKICSPREGTRERNYCERRIPNEKLQEILDLTDTAQEHATPYLGDVARLPEPLVEALIGRAINLDVRKTGLVTSAKAEDLTQQMLCGWDAQAIGQLSPDPLARLGFFTEGLVTLEGLTPHFRFSDIHADPEERHHIESNIIYPLRLSGAVSTDLENKIYVRIQELTYRVNNSHDAADWYLDEASRFFFPGHEATGNLFAGMGLPDSFVQHINLAYDFYKSISDAPPYETYVDFCRTCVNPLMHLRYTVKGMTDFMALSALYNHAIKDGRFYQFGNGKLPDAYMMAFKTFNPNDSFEIGVSEEARIQFTKATAAVHLSTLATMTKLHSRNHWNVVVSYDDCYALRDQIAFAPVNWLEHMGSPALDQSYRHVLKSAVLCYNGIIGETHPEDCYVVPLIADNDQWSLADEKPTVQ